MKPILLILAALLALVGGQMVAAQDACVTDLAPAVSALMTAQAQSSSGDSGAAVTSIREARAALAEIQAACATAGIEPVLLLDGEFTAPDSTFVFNYPSDWVFGTANRPNEQTLVQPLGNSARAAEQALQAEPLLAPGEQAAFVAVGNASTFGLQGSDTPAVLLNAIVAGLPEGFTAEAVTEATINDLPAASVRYTGPAFDGYLVVSIVSPELGLVAQVAGFAPSGELDPLIPVIDAIARSVR